MCDCIGSNIHSVLMFIGLASYLLADNRLPLACTGAAKSIYTDTVLNTLNSTLCNTIHYNNTLHIIQVSLWAPAVIIAFYALVGGISVAKVVSLDAVVDAVALNAVA